MNITKIRRENTLIIGDSKLPIEKRLADMYQKALENQKKGWEIQSMTDNSILMYKEYEEVWVKEYIVEVGKDGIYERSTGKYNKIGTKQYRKKENI